MPYPQQGDWFVTSDGPMQPDLRGSLYANMIQWITESHYNHAGIFIGEREGHPGNWVIEAQPSGVRWGPAEPYSGANTRWSQGAFITDPAVRPKIAEAAKSALGTPYGWLDIAAIGMAQKRAGRWKRIEVTKPWKDQPWWVQRLARMDHFICSQLCDWAYLQAGVHLFNDGRMSQLVSPGDLGRLLPVIEGG